MNIGAAFTRKLGPLPVWGWGIVVGGAGLGIKMLSGSGKAGSSATPGASIQQIPVATGPITTDPQAGFLNDLTVWMKKQEDALSKLKPIETIKTITKTETKTVKVPTLPPGALQLPAGVSLGEVIKGLRAKYPDIYKKWLAYAKAKGMPGSEYSGETAAQRTARLTQELAFFGAQLKAGGGLSVLPAAISAMPHLPEYWPDFAMAGIGSRGVLGRVIAPPEDRPASQPAAVQRSVYVS